VGRLVDRVRRRRAPCHAALHIGFGVPSRELVHAFWEAGVAAAYRDSGAPGGRRQYHAGYYAAYVLDPDDNNVELVDHRRG
jgi:hypothetical protein